MSQSLGISISTINIQLFLKLTTYFKFLYNLNHIKLIFISYLLDICWQSCKFIDIYNKRNMKRKGKNIKPVLKKEKKVKIKKAPKPIFTDTTETQYEEFDIITYLTDRYAIINKEGRIIDCAQGYGYKSITAAVKCANYKISTGMKFDFENKEEIK